MSPTSAAAVGAQELLAAKLRGLREHLAALGTLHIAFSGGVDSTFLLAVAAAAARGRTRAWIGISPALQRENLELARRACRRLGVALHEIETGEFTRPAYLANGPDRCFHCKDALFGLLAELQRAAGGGVLLDGTNRDDLRDHRPGRRAAAAHGVQSPLAELGWTKDEIRAASRDLGLETWDRPASPCLASRIPLNNPVSEEAVSRIEAAEAALRGLGFRDLRVRHHGRLARVEVPAGEVARLAAARGSVQVALRATGYHWAIVDLWGYRTGGAKR